MKKIKNLIDWISILIGLLALVSSIFGRDCIFGFKSICLTKIAGVLCAVYFFRAAYLYILSRPKFDWHLINGHFLRKVIAFVLLVPSCITSVFIIFNTEYSPKNLVFDDNLYSYEKADSICLGNIRSEIFADSVYIKAHNLYVKNDTVVMQKNKLPDSITSEQKDPSIFWTVYYHFIDPGNQHMTTSQSGRGWSALIAILGVFLLNGLLVSSIVGWIDSRKEKWLKGEVRYKGFLKLKKHYVVIGGNDVTVGIVSQIVNNIIETNKVFRPYVLIQTSRDVESFRRELFSNLTEEQQKLIIIYYGNRTSKEDIKDLIIENAKEVYIIGEDIRTDDIESYHDTMNMECLSLIYNFVSTLRGIVIKWLNSAIGKLDNIIKKRGDSENKFVQLVKTRLEGTRNTLKLTCRVMFEYQTSFNILQVTDVDGQKIDFRPFNYYETWAQNVLVCQELENEKNCEYLPLEGFDGIQADQDKFVHFIVIGMSRMGLAMAIEAAHLAHYPNFCTNKKRTRITFIDASMEQEKHFFMSRFKEMFSLANYRDITNATENIYSDLEAYPWLNPLEDISCKSPYCNNDHLGKDFIDIEWEFINGSVENPNIQQYLADAAANTDAKLTIAICLPENSRAIAAATYLPDSVYKSDSTLQILVYQRLNDNLLRQINLNDRYNKKLRAFGMAQHCYNTSLISISNFIDKYVSDAYSKFNEKRIKNIIENYNHELTESELCELSPSYAQLLERAEMQTLRDAIRHIWIDWFNQNSTFDDKWEERKNKLYSDIEERIGKAIKVYNVISKYKKTNTLTDAEISELSPMFSRIKDREDLQILRKHIYDRWVEWLECTDENWEENWSEVTKEIESKIIDTIGIISCDAVEIKSGKTIAAKMWSNTYNIYSMWTKFRCFRINPAKQDNFKDAMLLALGQMEHNRWIVEQLLLRYRALTSEEQRDAKIIGKYSAPVIKGRLKKDFAHLDICSNDKLNTIDYNMAELDQALVKVLPVAYREYLEGKART